MAIRLHSFLEVNGRVKILDKGEVKEVYFEDKKVGELLLTKEGYVFMKTVLVQRGQYFYIKKKVATAYWVIKRLEDLYKIQAYVCKFVLGNKTLGYIIYDYDYYKNNRRLIQEEGYELQYAIDLPENIEYLLSEAFESGKVFRIVVNEEGEKIEWIVL